MNHDPSAQRRRLSRLTLALVSALAGPLAQAQAEAQAQAPAPASVAQWGTPLRRSAEPAGDAATMAVAAVDPSTAPAITASAQRAPALASRSARLRTSRLVALPELLQVSPALPVAEGAAAPEPGATLALAAALPRGVAHSREVQATEARRESFAHTARAAAGANRPHLSLRVAQGRGRLDSESVHDDLDRHDSSLTLRQSVFDRPSELEIARQDALTRSAQLQWRAAVSTTSVDVASAYLQALQSRVSLELSREHETRLGELLAYIQQRSEAGGTSGAERDRVAARVANARSQMADSRAALRSALRNLEGLLGAAPAGLLVAAPDDLLVPVDPEAALQEARLANAELEAARAEIAAAGLEASGHGARGLPKVDAELIHSRGINTAGSVARQRDTKAQLVLSWSLMDGDTDRSQERAALARQREKALRLEDTERKLRQELDSAYANLDAVDERFKALSEELQANTAVVGAFQAQLVGGNRPLLDVLDAYQRLHQSRLDLTALVIGEVQGQVKVAHLTGRLFNLGSRP